MSKQPSIQLLISLSAPAGNTGGPWGGKDVGRDNTVGQVTIAPSMDNVGKRLFQLFVAGEV